MDGQRRDPSVLKILERAVEEDKTKCDGEDRTDS